MEAFVLVGTLIFLLNMRAGGLDRKMDLVDGYH